MKNVSIEIKNNKMTIVVDLSKDFGRSKSGKTVIIASTEGNQTVNDKGVVLGMNVYKKA